MQGASRNQGAQLLKPSPRHFLSTDEWTLSALRVLRCERWSSCPEKWIIPEKSLAVRHEAKQAVSCSRREWWQEDSSAGEQPSPGPPCHGGSPGWRPAWWLESLPCPSHTSKWRLWFFFHCSPPVSHFQTQSHLPPWLGSHPKEECKSSWLLENIWVRGREGAVKLQVLGTDWGKLCPAAWGRRTNQCHSTDGSHGGVILAFP